MKKYKGERKAAHDHLEIPYLPSEIIFNILSKLSALTLNSCKRVCKAWLNLIESDEFLKSHISSIPGLALKWEKSFKFIKLVDGGFDEHLQNLAFDLDYDLPFDLPLHSSAEGLLLLCQSGCFGTDVIICNPITREFIKLPPPPRRPYSEALLYLDTEIYGFGVSRMSGQYKVVRITFDILSNLRKPLRCHVYTVGSTGSWRRIECNDRLTYVPNSVGASVNGNLHWLAYSGNSLKISCLDLETELFTTFSAPLLLPYQCRTLSVLGDCLCVCDNSGDERRTREIYIWLMKEYGDVESWTEQFVIHKVDRHDFLGYIRPFKAFKDGSFMMELLGRTKILYYSSESEVIRQAGVRQVGGSGWGWSTTIFTPSFLSLKTFAAENVGLF